MQIVQEYGTVDEKLHYFRLKLNRTPSSFAELVKNKDNWYLYDKKHTRYHMNNSNNDINNVSIYISKLYTLVKMIIIRVIPHIGMNII